MDLVLKNPFRVLGLPVTASSREISKRVSDLLTFAEFGKVIEYVGDLSAIAEIDRSTDAIKDAARRIELPEARVFHSFFWFRDGDVVDQLALECLSNFEFGAADDIWGKQINKSEDIGKLTWRINRAVFSLWMSDDLESGAVYFEQALEDIGFVTDDLYEEATEGIPGAAQVSAEQVRVLIGDALLDYATNSRTQVYGPNAIQLIEHCWSFHPDTQDYIRARITKPLINLLQDAVDRSKEIRERGTTVDDLRRKNGLARVEHVIYELKDALGESNHRFQAIANSFSDEVISCAIDAINIHKAISTAIVLAEWAAELPSYGQTRKWLREERQSIIAWDPDYEPEEELNDDSTDIESKLDEDADEDQKSKLGDDKSTYEIICPICRLKFGPHEIREFASFGIRCPYCSQLIVT